MTGYHTIHSGLWIFHRKHIGHIELPWRYKNKIVSRRTFRIDSKRNCSPSFKQRFSLTTFPSLLTFIFIQLWRYFLPFLITTLGPCFLRNKVVFSTSRNPSCSWQVHRGAWEQGVRTAVRKGPREELEMPRHSADPTWRSFPSSAHSHCWFWLVPLQEPTITLWFTKRHWCFWTWTIWNPSGRWKAYKVLCSKSYKAYLKIETTHPQM